MAGSAGRERKAARDVSGFELVSHSDLGGCGDGMQVLREGDALYVAHYGLSGMGTTVLDVADPERPRIVEQWPAPPGTHTCLPLPARRLVVVTDEQLRDGPRAEPRLVRVVDVSDPASPRVAGVCPEPEGDFAERPLRFGPHNLHENRPGSYRSERFVFVTYFSGGLVVYDLADPAAPRIAAHWQPETPPGQAAPQTNDVFVDADGFVWLTDRLTGGLYVLDPFVILSDQ